MILAAVAILLAAGLYYKSTKTFTRQEVTAQIQQSRIVLSAQSCRQRNNERAVQRTNLRDNLRNLARISDAALEQLGFTREQAVAQIEKQLRQVAPLDCKKLIRQVAGNKTKPPRRQGGGSESDGAPRPPDSTGSFEGQPGAGGGSGPVEPPGPPEPDGNSPKPPPRDVPPTGSPSPPTEQPGPVEPPVIPHPNPGGIVESLVDGVGQVVQQLLP